MYMFATPDFLNVTIRWKLTRMEIDAQRSRGLVGEGDETGWGETIRILGFYSRRRHKQSPHCIVPLMFWDPIED